MILWAGTNPYRLISDINKSYMWSTKDSWVEHISRDIVEVWFSNLYGYWRTWFFSILVTLEDKFFHKFW
jgi:hypothetical protein